MFVRKNERRSLDVPAEEVVLHQHVLDIVFEEGLGWRLRGGCRHLPVGRQSERKLRQHPEKITENS